MYRYISYDLPNKPGEPSGVTTPFPGFNFAIGLTVHKGLETLLKTSDINAALQECIPLLTEYFGQQPERLSEMTALCQGIVYGWYRQRYPVLLEDYNILDAEKSYTWKISEDFDYNFRIDALLERKDDKRLVILDFKTTKKCDGEWARMFEHDIQSILYCRAAEEVLGITDLLGMQFEGMAKGFARTDTSRKSPFYGMMIQYSPYCYGYQDRDGGYHAEYHASYTRIRSWEHMTIPEWYDNVIAHTPEADDLFAIVPPFKPLAKTTQLVIDSIVREEDLHHAKVRRLAKVNQDYPELVIPMENQLFERHTDHCLRYGSDYRCSAYDICWTSGVREDLDAHGFVPRVPNHTEDNV